MIVLFILNLLIGIENLLSYDLITFLFSVSYFSIWTIIDFLWVGCSFGLIFSWSKFKQRTFKTRRNIILFSIINIVHEYFSNFYVVDAVYSPSLHRQVITFGDKIYWLLHEGYMDLSISLLKILILLISIFYLNQPKVREQFVN